MCQVSVRLHSSLGVFLQKLRQFIQDLPSKEMTEQIEAGHNSKRSPEENPFFVVTGRRELPSTGDYTYNVEVDDISTAGLANMELLRRTVCILPEAASFVEPSGADDLTIREIVF